MIISKMQILGRNLEGTTEKTVTNIFLTYCSYLSLKNTGSIYIFELLLLFKWNKKKVPNGVQKMYDH